MLRGQDGRRFIFQIGEGVHVMAERLEAAFPGIAQHLIQALLLRLAGDHGGAQRLQDFRRQFG